MAPESKRGVLKTRTTVGIFPPWAALPFPPLLSFSVPLPVLPQSVYENLHKGELSISDFGKKLGFSPNLSQFRHFLAALSQTLDPRKNIAVCDHMLESNTCGMAAF